jgi:hypothetical protein
VLPSSAIEKMEQVGEQGIESKFFDILNVQWSSKYTSGDVH